MFAREHNRREAANSMSTEMEWRFRGRTGSEATATAEPLPAPIGINAQKSEGFQRFYKAVISPSHVRVTAGGRIVPNTRTTSPMSKRLKEKGDEGNHAKDGLQQADDQAQQLLEGTNLTALKSSNMPVFAFPPHPIYPPFPAPVPGMPMMPLQMGLGLPAILPGSYPFPQLPGSAYNSLPFVPPEPLKAPAKENLQTGPLGGSTKLRASTFDKTEEGSRCES